MKYIYIILLFNCAVPDANDVEGGQFTNVPPGAVFVELNTTLAQASRPGRHAMVVTSHPEPDDDVGTVYKVLVLGSQGVGKTKLTRQLLTSEYLPNSENDAGN